MGTRALWIILFHIRLSFEFRAVEVIPIHE